MVSVIIPTCLKEIQHSYIGDSTIEELIAQLSVDKKGPRLYVYTTRVGKKRGKI